MIAVLAAVVLAGCASAASTTSPATFPSVTGTGTAPGAVGTTIVPTARPRRRRHRRVSAVSAAQATSVFRGQVASQFNGVVQTGDGRGCARTSRVGGLETFSCTAYVRNSQDSLDSGRDVVGSVTAGSQGSMSANARPATGNQIQNWFLKTGGGCHTNAC